MAQKKKPTAKKAPAKTPAKKSSVKKVAPDYSGMTLEELAIESGMTPERARESVAMLLMLGDTMEGIREHLLAKLAKRNAKGAAKTAPAAKKASAKKKARVVDPVIVEGIIASMVPIPGKDYRMGRFPVTQAQWEAVTGENPSEFKGAENPVEYVSWNDCQAFLETLNAQPAVQASGLVFRLPTEEEWEFAARAGASGDYCKLADGKEITEETLGEVAWFDEKYDTGSTHPVGQKKPNAFGLYDMHGNVWEWTATADGGDPAYHGGSWFDSAGVCESSYGLGNPPSYRHGLLGFRLCADRRAD